MKTSFLVSILLAASVLGCSPSPSSAPQASPSSGGQTDGTTHASQVVTHDGTPATAPMTREGAAVTPKGQAMLDKVAASLKGDTVEAHFERGQLYLMAGEQAHVAGAYAEAVKDFDWILKKEPKHLGALQNRGMAHARSGQLDQALVDYKAAVDADPTNDYPLAVYASILAKSGKDKEAIEAYTKAIALKGDSNSMARFNRGNAYLRVGDKAKAIEDFEVVAKSTDNPQMAEAAKMNLEAAK